MSYREPLPEGCPPDTAEEIFESRVFFRLVRTNPPTQVDFHSRRVEKPDAIFAVTECQARGLSLFAKRSDSERMLKLPAFRGRLVCRLGLKSGAGRVQKTGSHSHHTWWPLAAFDVLEHCEVEST